jgi:hypothetical protein
MTHADVLAWWALALAVLAIVLHMPLSMAAHHYLPKIEDYFASYSQERLRKRIANLQTRLDQLNDPKYLEDLEWYFREQLFLLLYALAAGLLGFASSVFLAVGAVPKNWFWSSSWTPGNSLPEGTAFLLVFGLFLAGRNILKSVSLRPSRRPKLMADIQAQIDALKIKLDELTPKPPRPMITVNGV